MVFILLTVNISNAIDILDTSFTETSRLNSVFTPPSVLERTTIVAHSQENSKDLMLSYNYSYETTTPSSIDFKNLKLTVSQIINPYDAQFTITCNYTDHIWLGFIITSYGSEIVASKRFYDFNNQ